MTAYLYRANCIAMNLAVGDSLAGAVGITPEDATTFTRCGTRLYSAGTVRNTNGPLGSHAGTPVAWFAAPLLTEREYLLVQEFVGDGPYPGLNAVGVSDAMIAAAKPHMVIEVGLRADIEAGGAQFIADAGYTTA